MKRWIHCATDNQVKQALENASEFIKIYKLCYASVGLVKDKKGSVVAECKDPAKPVFYAYDYLDYKDKIKSFCNGKPERNFEFYTCFCINYRELTSNKSAKPSLSDWDYIVNTLVESGLNETSAKKQVREFWLNSDNLDQSIRFWQGASMVSEIGKSAMTKIINFVISESCNSSHIEISTTMPENKIEESSSNYALENSFSNFLIDYLNWSSEEADDLASQISNELKVMTYEDIAEVIIDTMYTKPLPDKRFEKEVDRITKLIKKANFI